MLTNMAGTLKKLYTQLPADQRKLLSKVIGEVEADTYWETRQELLNKLLRKLEAGGEDAVRKHIKYMLSKPKPVQT